jgi:hypothetical protein
MQESRLINLPYGTADSLGLFQQRPSQGWGAPAQIMNPVYAATAFYQRLVQVPGWQSLPLTVAAQDVQRSADPGAYAQRQGLATTVVAQFDGQVAACAADNGRGVPAGIPLGTAAAQLGTTISHVRLALEKVPRPAREWAPATPSAAWGKWQDRARILLTREFFDREYTAARKTLHQIEAETGIPRTHLAA